MQREGEGSNRQDKLAYHRVDQAAFNYTPSQAATSAYAGSMSGLAGHRASFEDDSRTNASFYTSYTQATDDRLIRREGSRVSTITVD
jgi:hypothetical protein